MRALLMILLTESERTIISQRLDILRMLQKGFKYYEIQKKFQTTSNTISRSILNYDKNKEYKSEFDEILKKFHFDPNIIQENINVAYPNRGKIQGPGGGIRQFLREEKYEKRKKINKKD